MAFMPMSLITGPTAGLGRQFALQLAARGHDLVLVARDETRLTELALQLETDHGTKCEILPADLSKSGECARVERRVRAKEQPIDWLVNNAGFGLSQKFIHTPLKDEQRLLDVMVRAPMRLTHEALPGMIERGFGRVIVVSSIASWLTVGTYSAAKAWATVFCEAVSADLADTGVAITAVCPGFVHTEFHERADLEVSEIPSQAWLNADDVVATALADAEKGRVLSVPSLRYRTLGVVARLAPRALVRKMSKLS